MIIVRHPILQKQNWMPHFFTRNVQRLAHLLPQGLLADMAPVFQAQRGFLSLGYNIFISSAFIHIFFAKEKQHGIMVFVVTFVLLSYALRVHYNREE